MGYAQNDLFAREPIAIVGSACRLPGGASSPSKLWKLLEQPRDVLREVPPSRYNADGFYHPNNAHHGTANVRHAYTLEEEIGVFDAHFFGIKPVEANSIDPQQRILLETVYEGIEAAGLSLKQLRGSQTAVYVGVMSNDYGDMLAHDQDNVPTYSATGSARSNVSSRISYFFDWHGPSLSLDTACSSSLVAVHQAVQVLRAGDGTDVAVACGTNLVITPDQSISLSKLKMLSPEGRSRMWDEKASGYARGEGIAAVVLKRLSQAIEEGDHIECVIRETQTNHDGKTKGITMPSATAQTALIRAAYAKAGLDIAKASDRPQFFEAHGTGTPAGDPIESEAIHTAFFSDNVEAYEDDRYPLYVGSIKTVIGHTEGTAGIAAVLKASLALQHRVIPPNLLFDTLNPKLNRFYGDLEILKEARPWPALPAGAVPRVSVNSFGFGGANAHAILEAYPSNATRDSSVPVGESPLLAPLNFSAASESALRGMLQRYADFLDENDGLSVRDLAWTLNTRRSIFPVRTSVYGVNPSEIGQKLRERAESDSKVLVQVPSKALPAKPRVLGVFTGQGAQWARMGAELLLTCPAVASIIYSLERSLIELPDGPSWSIKDEILKTGDASRVNQAAISQPLCTAVQIVLVDLLRNSGVHFEAVVGHSSGEMGAAYAAGYLSASDAIRIAYYRGLHLHLAQGLNGEQGAMMAVGTSFDDAQELCDLPAFSGRISVAASNSSASVTLSGDLDAIEWAKDVFEDEKKFTRLLKVDKAYHSHHMLACADAYRKSLADCNITVLRPPRNGTIWVSSVYGDDVVEYRGELNNEYWIKNMVSPVLFSQALEFAAAEKAPFDIAIECGPHPALKGPALQVLQDAVGSAIPYTGMLTRGRKDNEAFADGLGYLWQVVGEHALDFRSLDEFVYGPAVGPPQVLSQLPTYAWDHERVFWHESRQYHANRMREHPIHELLGVKCPDGIEHQHRWRNMLRPTEVPWLSGHVIQSQIVFPAAGYVSTAIEAVKLITSGQPINAIEIEDFVIGQAFVFNDENASVEIQFTLTDVRTEHGRWRASFAYYSASQMHTSVMERNAWGNISATLGEPKEDVLPPKSSNEFNMVDVDSERFYESLLRLDFSLTGSFKALGSLRRKLGEASGTIRTPLSTDPAYNLLMHPAVFDSALQTIILAYCYPNDGRLRSVQLPIGITKITVNPLLLNQVAGKEANLHFKSTLTSGRAVEIEGDMELYDEEGNACLMQVEGLRTKPLGVDNAENDTPIFAEVAWDIAKPSRELSAASMPDFHPKAQLAFDIERVAFYYLRHLYDVATPEDREKAESHLKILFEYVDHTITSVQNDAAPFTKAEYFDDTYAIAQDLIQRYPNSIDMKLMHAVGEHLVPVIRGETTMLEYMREDNMLNDFYVRALGFDEYTECMSEQIRQLSHRYPHMNILEIGAGTGGATKRIFKKLGKTFRTYTYTDISTGFFEEAKEVFSDFASKMTFKPLNIEKDPNEQGFPEHSYDLVVASLVLHATHRIEETMKNARRLLRPGGYIVILELGDYFDNRTGLIFGTLPGWWMGYDDGRKLSPAMPEKEWDTVMRKSGFAGVDASVPIQSDLPVSAQVIIGQAVDDHINFLRDPLSPNTIDVLGSHLTIVGGTTERIEQIIAAASQSLRPFYGGIVMVKTLAELNAMDVPFMSTVLCMTDLDHPIFPNMDAEELSGAQQAFKQSRSCLWITQGCYTDNPYQHMSVGMARVARLEMDHLRYQSLDLDVIDERTADAVVKTLLQLEATEVWDQKGEAKNLLWSTEVELSYHNGHLYVPRLMTQQARNDRYNSARREISKDLNPRDTPIGLRRSSKGYELHDESATSAPFAFDGRTEVQVAYSTLQAIRVSKTDYAYLVFGTNRGTKEQVFALSPAQHSIVRVYESWTVPYSMASDEALRLMPLIQNHLVALATISEFSSGETLVILEPNKELARILSRLASEKGIHLILITTTDRKGSPWVAVHPKWPRRVLRTVMPATASCLIVCSNDHNLVENVTACLPPNCDVRGTEFFTSHVAKLDSFSSMAFIPSILRSAFVHAHHDAKTSGEDSRIIPITSMLGENVPTDQTTLISWMSNEVIPVRITPVDMQPLFSAEKTYWLVGLTGGLGLSLCEWMVENGARYVVLSSRSPKVDPEWEDYMQSQGATIRLFANDITDRESVRATHKDICENLPPIGGVAQGAMVLADAMFIDLDIERVRKVMTPKVVGSNHLDEIFAETPLDFFVFLSSMANVSGNPGQSIYAAANAYMTTLMAMRRKRGLAASAINLGSVYGRGYVTEHLTKEQIDFLYMHGNMPMSEQTFHQIFAEAVLASRQDATDSPELMTGLRKAIAGTSDENILTWFHNPKFSHHVIFPDAQGANAVANKQSVTVRSQLLVATTPDEVKEAIEEGFVAKLKTSLQIDAATSISTLNAEQLGLDSLVAVEIRSWFIKELQVEMPVLKILGGFTVSELVVAAQETLPDSLVPNLGKDIDPSLKASARAPSEVRVQELEPMVPNASEENAFVEFDEDEGDMESPLASFSGSSSIADPNPSQPQKSAQPSRPKSVTFSSDTSSADSSDSENHITRKRALSTHTPGTSMSMMDDYFTEKEDIGIERVIPMSFGQARFWFLKFYMADQTTFNITTSIRLNGHLDVDRFKRAVRALGKRHEALRTTFFSDKNGQPMQGVLRQPGLKLQHRYISSEQEIDVEYDRIKNHVYDLEHGETMQISLLTRSHDVHQFIIGYHHINMDGMSLEVIFSDLQDFYYNQRPSATVMQYPDFSRLQAKEHGSGRWKNEIAFWQSEFPNIPETLRVLPISKTTARSPLTKYTSNTANFKLDAGVCTQIQNVCKKTRTSPFNFYLAALKALLHRYIGEETSDVCIGMADGGRNVESVSNSIGFFLNLLPLRFQVEGSQPFNEALKEARAKVVSALANSRIPFDVLINELHAPRDPTHNPLFQAFINYRPIQDKREYMGCESEATKFDGSQTAYDISIDILGNPGGEAAVYLSGQASLYSQDDVEILAHSYQSLLKAFARNPALRLNRPSLYDSVAVQRALDIGRGPVHSSAWPATLAHRFDDMVKHYGFKVALRMPTESVTYSQMSRQVHAIASVLKANGLGQDSRVGVLQDPTSAFFCTLLAVFRIGATFIPLELRQGIPRVTAIVRDSKPDAIVYDRPNQKIAANVGSRSKKINISQIPHTTSVQVQNDACAAGSAVLLYTSGSTGKPKGILLSHEAWLNQIQASSHAWNIKVGVGVHLQHSAWSFDISMSQTFVALANGATLFVMPKEHRGDSLAISRMIGSEGINYVQATPSELVSWLQNADTAALRTSKWRFAMSGGERTTTSLIQEFRKLAKRDLRLVNAYGPAEITLAIGSADVNYESDDNLGTPFTLFPNYSAYILDNKMQPVAPGVPGEIYIGGAGVAQGYLNNEALSKERFPPDDFAPSEYIKNNWLKMHKSGDRGRLTNDGRVTLEGRIDGDTQIKLRGMRIDLEEIESSILRAAAGRLKDVVVSLRASGETEFLVAHVVLSTDLGGDSEDYLRKLLASSPLPLYMHPAMAIPLPQLPMNHSGKVDRRALAALPLQPKREETKESASIPQTQDPETQLKEIWEQVLGAELLSLHQISSDTDFFHVGGNSLALVKIQGLIRSHFSVEVSLVKLFENPTLAGMLRHIDPTSSSSKPAPIIPVPTSSISNGASAQDHLLPTGAINWDHETALTDDLYNVLINPFPKDLGSPYKTVIITGATGFLGKEIVRQMINDKHIDKIHAIAVRRRRSDLPAIFSHPKIELHSGDLNAPRLGLSSTKALTLFAEADAIIHNGADVSFLKTYRTLSKTNVGSTRELVKLCLPNRIPIHFISSASVAHLSGKPAFGEESISTFEPPRDGGDGYTATKWASERFLERVSENFDIPIWIHRPSSITGDDAPELDLMTNMLAYSRKLRKVPISTGWRGTLDFVSVENAAVQILDEVRNDSLDAGMGLVMYVHESGDLEVGVEDMQSSLEQQTGQRFQSVSVREWAREAVREGMDELVASYLESVAATPLMFPKLLKARRGRSLQGNLDLKRGHAHAQARGWSGIVGRWLARG